MAFDGDGFLPVLTGGKTKTQTELARRLTPPKPKQDHLFVTVGLGILAAFAAWAALTTISQDRPHPLWALLAIVTPAVILGGTVYASVAQYASAKRYNSTTYRPLIDAWRKAWVCLSCGDWFFPGET